MIDISEMDDGQVRSLAKELALVVSEKNLFVGAQFMADLEDALLEIREGIKAKLDVPPPPSTALKELEEGDRILPLSVNSEVIEIDRTHKTGQVVLKVFDPYRQTSVNLVLPPGVYLVKDPDRSYTGTTVKKSNSPVQPPGSPIPNGNITWSTPSPPAYEQTRK